MSKTQPKSTIAIDVSRYCRSVFKLTFVVEILGLDVWEDVKEGVLELGPYLQGMKIQYQLYPGQMYDLDILIWPHVAKIWCGTEYGWVRTWQFLEHRWLTFSIAHAFPVRVVDLQSHLATITPTNGVGALGSIAKNDKSSEVILPPLCFGVRRYFAPVLECEGSITTFVQELIWNLVEQFIPWSCFDELFDIPHPVSDVRHQDACVETVRDLILKKLEPGEIDETFLEEDLKIKEVKDTKTGKDKDKRKVVEAPKVKFEIKLPGEAIMAGTGRVVSFETVGELPPDTPVVIVLISSNNLPAPDDQPIIFINIENLTNIPLKEIKSQRITHLYTKWQLGDETYCSEPQPLKSKTTVNFNTHRTFPIAYELFSKTTTKFLDKYVIELRGIKLPSFPKDPKLFGYDRRDRDFGRHPPKVINEDLDFLIAITKIDGRALARGINSFMNGEYPLYPPTVTLKPLEREGYCTNDINSIRAPIVPTLIVKPHVILEAQMCLEVSIGVVGCKTRMPSSSFSRMFCTIKNSEAIMEIVRTITDINENILLTGVKDELMSGFALDTGNVAILFVEGPRDGNILHVWDMTEDFYPDVKPMFSCSDRYSTRIYPELLSAAVPFIILKMFVPLGVLLACPPTYARPTLPLPTRAAVLKIGRLIASDLRTFPSRYQMPTAAELKSFRLELCVAPRPTPIVISDNTQAKKVAPELSHTPLQTVSRINWDWNK